MPLRPTVTLAAALASLAVSAAPAGAALHLSSIGDFSSPVYVTAPPGDPHRVFVVEQAGRIFEVRDGVKQTTPFLDISSQVRSGGEQGLLSMAFAPDYATSGRYYVYYTAPRPGDSTGSVITVEEFSPTEHHVVFTVDHPVNSNHNGGQLQFGPDGLLYAGTGDGGSGNDPPNNAQNLSVNLGKLLRVDPLSSSASRPSIFAYGLRNPFRFSFDRRTGNLIIGDVGQDNWEEVDFSPAGLTQVRNYGWHCREGFHATPGVSCTAPGAVDPVLEKSHSSDGFCAIIGGYVVRDPSLGSLAGRYVYGDNCATAIRSVTLPAANDDAATGLTVNGLSSFGEDSCGHVYATSLNGPVYRIDGDSFSPCSTGGTDTMPPVVLKLTAFTKQRAARNSGFWVRTRCNELCGVTVTGSMHISGQKHVYKLKRTSRLVAPGAAPKVTAHLWSRGLRALKAALKRHRKVTATLDATALDAAKNEASGTQKLRAIR
jgi:hypothetical protein